MSHCYGIFIDVEILMIVIAFLVCLLFGSAKRNIFLVEETMENVINQLIGLVVGLLGSYVFWRYMIIVRPKIKISPFVLYSPKSKRFFIRVMNFGRRQVTDIQVRLLLSERINEGEGAVTIGRYVPKLRRDSLFALGVRRDYGNLWKYSPVHNFSTDDDEQELLEKFLKPSDGDKRLEFQMLASDALSGTTVAYSTVYSPKDIKFASRYKREFVFDVVGEIEDFIDKCDSDD